MFLEGFGLEGRRGLPFGEKIGMVCVYLYVRGIFQNRQKVLVPHSLGLSLGVELLDFLEGQSWTGLQRAPVSPNP